MRIAVGQLWQESNTFNPLPTTATNFDQFGVLRGAEVVEKMAETNELGGFIQSLRKWPEQPEIVGLVRLPAWPSGRATAATFDWIVEEIVAAIKRALPVDGVLLAFHGAMAADGHPDVEGEVLHAVRQLLGAEIPLVGTLDLHANVTQLMVEHADALVLYHTAPHIDVYETGVRGAAVSHILVDRIVPTTSFVKVPAVLTVELANTQAETGVSADLKRKLQTLEQRPDVLTAGIATVQPWLDIPEFGSAVLVTTAHNSELAHELSADLANTLWSRRREYLPDLWSIEDAVSKAHANHTQRVVVLSDAADATTSGAPGDSVWILREMLKYEWPRPALVTLVSPELVASLGEYAPGQPIQVELGGVRDHRFGTKIHFDGHFEKAFDARFVLNGHLGKNMAIDMGRSIFLRRGNVCVIVTTLSGPHFAPELFQTAGFDPFTASILIAKSPCGFRAVYTEHAAAIYNVRSPGCAPTDFWNYPFEQIERPLWPWDEFEYAPEKAHVLGDERTPSLEYCG